MDNLATVTRCCIQETMSVSGGQWRQLIFFAYCFVPDPVAMVALRKQISHNNQVHHCCLVIIKNSMLWKGKESDYIINDKITPFLIKLIPFFFLNYFKFLLVPLAYFYY